MMMTCEYSFFAGSFSTKGDELPGRQTHFYDFYFILPEIVRIQAGPLEMAYANCEQ
jgi:hypothetical protein